MKERLRKIGIRADWVLTEIARVALSDLRKVYNADGSLKLPIEWEDDMAAAISGSGANAWAGSYFLINLPVAIQP